ncbi:hypothetical protein C7999DRAFT_44389 [Corynascus novoguineensis]|uniref:Zn(2)-C6 fungal-type domain-containing protein n=1 Tax=Corynascus novoguineensis TaxID=1126955 RepID=A0AAN7HFY0_9PEZI|nr:hypothetical protein C7999DRAFT_44389 [Corynascus novoguineensis]
MGENSRRHCWECLRRYVVCDSTRPACNRCTANGSLCPGYGNVKPTRLVWLAPGKVKSRVRKRKGSPSGSAETGELRDQGQAAISGPLRVTAAGQGSRIQDAGFGYIPHFNVYTDADALFHAAEYCKFNSMQTIHYLQQGASLNWRSHVEGAIRLVQLRGGFAAVANCKVLEPQLVLLCFMAVIGNTTCPAADLSMTRSHLIALDVIQKLYRSTLTPFQMCPAPLFAEIIRINHLRQRAVRYASQGLGAPNELAQIAHETLNRVHAFSPAHWASTKPRSQSDWALMGAIYQAAVALYGASALRSLSVLPPTVATVAPPLDAQLLQRLLARALACPRIRHFTLWPLVVLGVQAAHEGCAETRDFVTAQLPVLARHGGTYAPLTAKGVLEKFWTTGETRWDACFDRPYAFVMQIAVDTSPIMSSASRSAL